MKKSTVAILGVGEIGSSIAAIFEKKYRVLKKDLKFDQIKKAKINVLHVCIPYNSKFQSEVIKQIEKNRPELVIIHSTVKPGSTDLIYRKTKTLIVHSPVMGTHPNLKNDILKFSKFIGPVNKKAAQLANRHLMSVGIKTIIFKNPSETELGKLLDTTYYAWNILFNKMTAGLCRDLNIDFENVYITFNNVYNRGYRFSRPQVIRPVLKFREGPIGGHCVIPNAEILNDFKKNQLTDIILKYNKGLTKK